LFVSIERQGSVDCNFGINLAVKKLLSSLGVAAWGGSFSQGLKSCFGHTFHGKTCLHPKSCQNAQQYL
jgi:hypothetical protein